MLDEHEFSLVAKSSNGTSADRFKAMLDEYNRITGFNETNANAVWHHQISIYGPPCPNCGKVLRTLLAHKCFECGQVVRSPSP